MTKTIVSSYTEEDIEELERILSMLKEINNEKVLLKFLTVEDIVKATGYSKKIVLDIFRDPEFPSCNFGKKQIIELNAAIKYFSVPRKKEYSKFWRDLT